MAPALLKGRTSRTRKGVLNENTDFCHVQKSSRPEYEAAGVHMQALRSPDLFVDVPESASRSTRQKVALMFCREFIVVALRIDFIVRHCVAINERR
jgi:hypothetical protein